MTTLDSTSAPSRPVGVARICNTEFTRDHVDYLHYHYLIPAIRRAAKAATGRLLDLGCGNKPYQSLFKNVTEYIGCDIAQSSASVVDVICPADAIPLPDESFDALLSTQTIEHVGNYQGMLAEANRLLKPGGTLFISGPMYWYLHEVPYDYYRFTAYGFRWILERAGFEVISVEPNGGKWAVLGLVILHTFRGQFIGRKVFNKLINSVCLWLDQRKFNPISTDNYFVTARRPVA